MHDPERIKAVSKSLLGISDAQLSLIEHLIHQFTSPFVRGVFLVRSDLVNKESARDLGDTLRIHHSFSREPFTKDKFEFALEKTLNNVGVPSKLAPKGNPGYDITVAGNKFSLKTQANKSIRVDKLHISKFMELGKGHWGDQEEDLIGLRDQYIEHMKSYDRILSLRCLSQASPNWIYELVEIPKELMLEAQNGELRMMHKSKQFPKPGYCDVFSHYEGLKFQLYFDGGTERKLQIKNLLKKYCIVHATWEFEEITIM